MTGPEAADRWELGIDYGTTYTVAAIARERTVTVLDIEANGRSRMPSSAFLNPDGNLLVGTAAQHQAAFAPERFESTPKRSLGEGEIFLGDRLVEVVDLAAATIGRAYEEACAHQGGSVPSAVRITHPAIWAETRLDLLREAVGRAGIDRYELLPEPVAAAARIGLLATAPGEIVAVYDFGGGTFDAAVLRRTVEGFEIAGRPTGQDPLGGEEIDRRLVEHLATVLRAGNEGTWESLLTPPDPGWRRRSMELRTEVQRAKETLSEATVCQLWLPGLEREAQLTREELDVLVQPDIDLTLDTLAAALANAEVTVADLSGIYLVGGSSRIPLVADAILARTGKTPSVQENPKAIVAMGAAGWDLLTSVPAPSEARGPATGMPHSRLLVPEIEAGSIGLAEVPAISAPPHPSDPATTFVYRPRLVMAVGAESWDAGCSCIAELEINRIAPPALTVRARDEPARTSSTQDQVARTGARRAARTTGYAELAVAPVQFLGDAGIERRFEMVSGGQRLKMRERYLTAGGRALVMASPEDAGAVATTVTLLPALARGAFFESRWSATIPPGWTVTERLILRRNGTRHVVEAACVTTPTPEAEAAWRRDLLDASMAARPGAATVGSSPGPVLNRFRGEVVTLRWQEEGRTMLTKIGLAVSNGYGYSVSISLAETELSLFPALARHGRVGPAAQ